MSTVDTDLSRAPAEPGRLRGRLKKKRAFPMEISGSRFGLITFSCRGRSELGNFSSPWGANGRDCGGEKEKKNVGEE